MEKLTTDLDTQLQLLNFTRDKSEGITAKGNVEAVDRQLQSLRSIVTKVEDFKLQIEQAKIANGEKLEDVSEWSLTVEAAQTSADENIAYLRKWLTEYKQRERLSEKEGQQAFLEQSRKDQLEFERTQLEMRLTYEKKIEETKANHSKTTEPTSNQAAKTAKLPKLVITKFRGELTDWPRFWSQFETEIDKAEIAGVTKYSYLKELVDPKIRAEIDGLPFSVEGYERAKNILARKYGQTSEVVNAYVENIMSLPTIGGTQPARIHDFYEKLLFNVQSLETMGKLREVNGYVRMTIDKLPGIRGDLVRTDDSWREWNFPRLVDELRKWTERNPIQSKQSDKPWRVDKPWRDKNFQVQQQRDGKNRGCVYCESQDHRSVDCKTVASLDDRKRMLSNKRLCFNCTGGKHRAEDCKSRSMCQICKRRHHTSICNSVSNQLMTATSTQRPTVIYPVVVVEVMGVKCRALLDTGAGSSYASAALLDHIKIRPHQREVRQIEMMMGVVTKPVEIFKVQISSLQSDFILETDVTKVNKAQLLSLENPRYQQVLERYDHLKGVKMDDMDPKDYLPVHLILGVCDYTKIKTVTAPLIGAANEPIAEKTKFGWTIISPGKEVDLSPMFLTQTSTVDYDNLCRLDVLGLADCATGDQDEVYSEFKEQLRRDDEGWYETSLPWKGNHAPLPTNEAGSLRRLTGLVKKLRGQGMIERYDQVIQDQIKTGIVERVSTPATGQHEFYIPHKAVVRDTAETTKLRVVYDASARAYSGAPSLNECLNPGPPLQNKLWSVLVRSRFHPIAVAGDIKQAFLQVRIKEPDRDALRFHWLKDPSSQTVETLRFTRALFGLTSSPFLLGGVIQHLLESCRQDHPDIVSEIERSLYVDDLISGGPTCEKAKEIKSASQEVFAKGTFELHKWHSNVRELESAASEPAASEPVSIEEETYAKEQLNVPRREGATLLGLPWDKANDTIGVSFPQEKADPSKRGILSKVARIYDPLGLASPISLGGKLLYRDVCDAKLNWDSKLPGDMMQSWIRWEKRLPEQLTVPRSLAAHQEDIQSIELHAFGDASGKGVAAAVYAVVNQESGSNQGLVAARARLSKRGLTIPRLELVSGHMAVNLLVNVASALDGFPLTEKYCWLDSTVALHWIRSPGTYKQFVSNRVEKIQAHSGVTWRHVGTLENPADLGSRGGEVKNHPSWSNGPKWLKNKAIWPPDIVTKASEESMAEVKATRDVFAVAIATTDGLDNLLEKFTYWRTMRICAWIMRFVHNARSEKIQRHEGPLTTEETNKATIFWVKRVQTRATADKHYEEDRLQLNLQPNQDGVLECRGRIQGHYPVYLPESQRFTEKLVTQVHLGTLHGGVVSTMAKVRELYWVPRLRRLTKGIVKSCHGCRRFQAQAFSSPPQGDLPKDRTEGSSPFQVVGVDYAGPIKYRISKNREGKAYIVLYACSLTRAVYLEPTKTLETEEFIGTLKRLIARKGRPEKIYSDNGKTFVGAAKWLNKVMKDERLHDFLAKINVKWQFNLSRAPWWGGQFERLVGLVKRVFYKTVGNGTLTWDELQDVLLDVEVTLNNRPLSYLEEDIQLPILTPSTFLYGQPNMLPELEPHHVQEHDLRKRAKYLRKCKDTLWSRWTREYLRGLRERHRLKHKGDTTYPSKGEVVIIKSEEKNRAQWKLGVVEDLITGRDGVIRGAKLKTGKSRLERPIQHLYPLELSCDMPMQNPPEPLNPMAPIYRPQRDAAAAARVRIQDMNEDEQ